MFDLSILKNVDSSGMYKIYDEWPKIAEESFNFKHKKIERDIDVVIYDDNSTENKFEKFFGKDNVNINQDGLSGYVSKLQY